MAFGFYFDMTRCIGCRACQVACKDKNRLGVGTLYRGVKSYTVGTFPDVKTYSYSASCNHCEDPICMKNCPVGAIEKAEDGTVIQDQEKCIGCRMCVMSCPYGHPKYFPEKGVSGKCDGCYGIRANGRPACVRCRLPQSCSRLRRCRRTAREVWRRFERWHYRGASEP